MEQKKGEMTTTPERLNAALARELVENDFFRVHGKQTGYRNKICYSLVTTTATPTNGTTLTSTPSSNNQQFQVSDQAMPLLNNICMEVNKMATEYVARKDDAPTTRDRVVGRRDCKDDDGEQQQQQGNVVVVANDPWCNFFVEVTAKVTRLGEVMVKLNVTAPNANAFITSGDAKRFATQLADAFPTCVRCVVLQVAPDGKVKGNKYETSLAACDASAACSPAAVVQGQGHTNADDDNDDDSVGNTKTQQQCCNSLAGNYIPLLDGRVMLTDLTPNGVPFQLSVDSFVECNYDMEKEMHNAALKFLRAPAITAAQETDLSTRDDDDDDDDSATCRGRSTSCSSNGVPMNKKRAAIILGRDCNVVYLSMKHIYADRALLVTNCPRARQDAADMKLPNFLNVPKPDIAEVVFGNVLPEMHQRFSSSSSAATATTASTSSSSSPDAVEWDLLVTAGRHGIHPSAREAIVENADTIENFLYTSCNLDSLTRDLHVFRRAYYVRDCRTFDFFPGTRYNMTMVHFRALTKKKSCCYGGVPFPALMTRNTSESGDAATAVEQLKRTLLVLPVGAPGCGKSSCARALVKAMGEVSDGAQQKQQQQKNKRNKTNVQSHASTTRAFSHRPELVHCSVFERDDVFRHERQVYQRSLSSTKTQVHNQLISFLAMNDATSSHHAAAAAVSNSDNSDTTTVAINEPLSYSSCSSAIRVLDSTNGSNDQRQEYVRMFRQVGGSEGRSNNNSVFTTEVIAEMRPVIEVWFDAASTTPSKGDGDHDADDKKEHPTAGGDNNNNCSSSVEDVLYRRCMRRQDHPAFPTEEAEARRKIRVITDALEKPSTTTTTRTSSPTNKQNSDAGVVAVTAEAEAAVDRCPSHFPRSSSCFTVRCGGGGGAGGNEEDAGVGHTLDQFLWCCFLALFTDAVDVGLPLFQSRQFTSK